MSVVRIMADDLSGALDTASQFTDERGGVAVLWGKPRVLQSAESFAFDTETREADETTAVNRVAAAAGMFRNADICFKKVDSLLRGSPAQEVAACFAGGGFRSAVVAPAFPAQRRMTRGGVQYYRSTDSEDWRPVSCDLAAAFSRCGLSLKLASKPQQLDGSGLFLCDADRDADLVDLCARRSVLEPPILWCGSAGLAMALHGAAQAKQAGIETPMLLVVGSDAPCARAQVQMLNRRIPDCIGILRETTRQACTGIADGIARRLESGRSAGLAFMLDPGLDRQLAGRRIGDALEAMMPRLPRPCSLLVCGGGTLFSLCQALSARSITVSSDLFPGVPVSRFSDGDWSGTPLVTKSGSFGDASLIADILENGGEHVHDRV